MMNDEAAWRPSGSRQEDEPQLEVGGETIGEEVKLQIHVHYLRQYLTGEERVLEIGAGRGRFTAELARLCGRIVVGDISPTQLDLNRRNAQAIGYTQQIEDWIQCDVADLTRFREGEFDAVVCYGGPLSYVTDQRVKALRELVRVTKAGGLLFLSVMSLWGEVHSHFPDLTRSDPRLVQDIVRTGDIGPDAVAVAKAFYHAFKSDEFRAFLEEEGLIIEVLAASDCLSSTWGSLLSTWRGTERRWRLLMDMELQATQAPGCLDMGSRLIAVARKP